MFRAIILPIFRSIRLCVTACGIMHPRCCRPVAWKRMEMSSFLRFRVTGRQHRRCITPQAVTHTHTQTHTHTHAHTSAPEDGRDCRSKHVKLIGIINKPLLLHLVGCLYYLNQLTSYFVTERRTGAEVAGIPPGSRAANLRMRLTSPVGSIHEKNTNLVAMDTYLPPHSSE